MINALSYTCIGIGIFFWFWGTFPLGRPSLGIIQAAYSFGCRYTRLDAHHRRTAPTEST
jgi:hypothetical protein